MKTFQSIMVASSLPVIAAALLGLYQDASKDQTTTKNTTGFAVVELFTSEGCNTCPPADKLIEKLQREDKTGQVYILAFHVHYWDHQGWIDRFSDPKYTRRQQQYADRFGLYSIYTPQVVVNGTSEMVGVDEHKVVKAISEGLEADSQTTLTVHGKTEGGKVNIEYFATGVEANSELVLALIQKSAQSNVVAGENEGKKLSHVQIVRTMRSFTLEGDGGKTTFIKLPNGFDNQPFEVIGFVQNKLSRRISAAAKINLGS